MARAHGGKIVSFARAFAWAYLVALVTAVLVLRLVGEDLWLLVPVLYAPRFVFALPLVLTLPALLWAGPRWMLLTQIASLAIVLFPLMGLELHLPVRSIAAGTPKIRVLSYNIFFGDAGCAAIVNEAAVHAPDVVVFQAANVQCTKELAARFPSFEVQAHDEFVLASRFPVRGVFVPPTLAEAPYAGSAFVRYTLETPIGLVDLYSMHPYSPRHAFQGVREDLTTPLVAQLDEAHFPAGRAGIEHNTSVRRRQVEAVTAAASHSSNPVVIAGDTNLPRLSHIYARTLGAGRWKDGFAEVGGGFGYTFPTHWKYHLGPWMRLDRVFAGPELRFLRFEIGGRATSDHRPVIADLAAATSPER